MLTLDGTYKPPQTNYITVVRNGKTLFRFDPVRGVVEIQSRGTMEFIDLAKEIEQSQGQFAIKQMPDGSHLSG